jgi:hypothetical protein
MSAEHEPGDGAGRIDQVHEADKLPGATGLRVAGTGCGSPGHSYRRRTQKNEQTVADAFCERGPWGGHQQPQQVIRNHDGQDNHQDEDSADRPRLRVRGSSDASERVLRIGIEQAQGHGLSSA